MLSPTPRQARGSTPTPTFKKFVFFAKIYVRNPMRILFTGGGTGGHIYPIIAVARQLKKIPGQSESLKMMFLGPVGPYRQDLEKEGIKVKSILAGKLRRYFSILTILDILKAPVGLLQVFWYLYIYMPDVVFSKGGYGAVPVVFVSWLYFIPVFSHESDAVPGLANRIGAILSKKIAISFKSTEKYFPAKKTALIGNPVRLEIVQICLSTNPGDKEKARGLFSIFSQKPVVLILGGSQGAERINQLVLSVLSQLLEKYEVIHQCGPNNYEKIKQELKNLALESSAPKYHLFPYLDENQIAHGYLASDLIISRAGAGSISEIAACHKPSILIPLPKSASDHQRKNAFSYAQAGATSVLEQGNLTPNMFLSEIAEILDSQEVAQQMKENAETFSQPEAASKIAQELIELSTS